MLLTINHTTAYDYDEPMRYGLQQVRLSPIDTHQQKVLDWSVNVEGGSVELGFEDQYKNKTLLVQVDEGQTNIKITASGTVETKDTSGILGRVYGAAPLWHFTQSTERTMPGKHIKRLAKRVVENGAELDSLHALSSDILQQVPYQKSVTFADTTAEAALIAGGGVCQDHTQIFVSAARLAGIPARYVSGYLLINGQIHQEASHAWAEAHLEGLGWVGFDVSNSISPDERYVRLATGLDSNDAAPISGVRSGPATESMIVSLQVQQ